MSTRSYHEILQLARKKLSEAELQRLAEDLKNAAPQQDGAADSQNGTTGSVYDSMSRRGLVGKLTSAPADLSTNPIHMEGFGKDAQ